MFLNLQQVSVTTIIIITLLYILQLVLVAALDNNCHNCWEQVTSLRINPLDRLVTLLCMDDVTSLT